MKTEMEWDPFAGSVRGESGNLRFNAERLLWPMDMDSASVRVVTDLFGAGMSNDEIAVVFGVMAACPSVRFLMATSHPERMAAWMKWAATPGGSQPGWVLEEAAPWVLRGRPRWYDAMRPPERVVVWRDRNAFGVNWPLPNVSCDSPDGAPKGEGRA